MKLQNNPYSSELFMIVAFFGPVLVLCLLYVLIYYIVTEVKKYFRQRYLATKIPLNQHVGLDLEDVRMDSYSGELPGLITNISILDTSTSVTHSTRKMSGNIFTNNPSNIDSSDRLSGMNSVVDRIEYDGSNDIFNINDSEVEDSSDIEDLRSKSQYSKKNN